MLWVKRHFFFALGCAVAVILLGLGVFRLLDQLKQNKIVWEDLQIQWAQLDNFYGMSIFPNNENVRAVQADQAKLRQFLADSRAIFAGVPPVQFSGVQGFKTELDKAVSQLNQQAKLKSVAVPTNYMYSFQAQSVQLNFSPGSMRIMAQQLAEIQKMCQILFNAEINRLEAVQRAREDATSAGAVGASLANVSSADYVPQLIQVTPLATVYPYRLTFRCFSSELAAVMDGFMTSPHGFVIKTVDVEPVPLEIGAEPGGAMPFVPPVIGPPTVPPPGVPPRWTPPPTRRLPPGGTPGQPPGGMRGPGGTRGQPDGTEPPTRGPRGRGRDLQLMAAGPFMARPGPPMLNTNKALVTILNEKPFRVSLYVESITLR